MTRWRIDPKPIRLVEDVNPRALAGHRNEAFIWGQSDVPDGVATAIESVALSSEDCMGLSDEDLPFTIDDELMDFLLGFNGELGLGERSRISVYNAEGQQLVALDNQEGV